MAFELQLQRQGSMVLAGNLRRLQGMGLVDNEESTVSVAKLALTTLPPFTCSLLRMHLAQPLSEPGTLAKRYEALSRPSYTLVSQTPEDMPCNLSALMRPLLDFDFLDLIVFKEGSSEVLWHSIGAGQIPTPDVPMQETTYWWVYQQKQPLFISDWKSDERFAARREALKSLGLNIAPSAGCRYARRLARRRTRTVKQIPRRISSSFAPTCGSRKPKSWEWSCT